MAVTRAQTANHLLRMLSPDAFAKIADHLRPIDLPSGLKLCAPASGYRNVVFPSNGIVSVIGIAAGIWQEVGLLGKDGAAGLSTLLSRHSSPYLVVVQVPGLGHDIPVSTMRSIFESDKEIRELALAYTWSFIVQISQTAFTNVQLATGPRLARWLMMLQDRLGTERLVLSHDYVAAMLGVGRTTVTLSIQALEEAGLISTSRKLIVIRDREGLSALCSGLYGLAEREAEKIMGARLHKYTHP